MPQWGKSSPSIAIAAPFGASKRRLGLAAFRKQSASLSNRRGASGRTAPASGSLRVARAISRPR